MFGMMAATEESTSLLRSYGFSRPGGGGGASSSQGRKALVPPPGECPSPSGAISCSQGREALDVRRPSYPEPQRARHRSRDTPDVAPPELRSIPRPASQGLAPLATRCRPSGPECNNRRGPAVLRSYSPTFPSSLRPIVPQSPGPAPQLFTSNSASIASSSALWPLAAPWDAPSPAVAPGAPAPAAGLYKASPLAGGGGFPGPTALLIAAASSPLAASRTRAIALSSADLSDSFSLSPCCLIVFSIS